MVTYWTVPLMWPGETVAIIGGGPSLTIHQVIHLKGPRIVINGRFRMLPEAEMLFAEDSMFWVNNPDAAQFKGLKVGIEQLKGIAPEVPKEVLVLRNTGIDGFDIDPSAIRTGMNSGYGAVHVAAHTGASRIELYGFDMHDAKGRVYATWMDRLTKLRVELARRGVEVINKTPGSSIPW